MASYPKVAQFKTVDDLRQRLDELDINLPCDDTILTAEQGSSLATPIDLGGFTVGNRWCIHPMEGWDANRDGSPSEKTLRRWRNFGRSGAKLIWGGEAAAVQSDGRANPNQTLATPENEEGLKLLLDELLNVHQENFRTTNDLCVGLQLTHSGRFSRPNSKTLEPRIAYHHPLLDKKFGIDPCDNSVVWTDADLQKLIDNYIVAAKIAQHVGFQFVDVKACHGYLLHEFLSARSRPGMFGGSFQGRTRLLRTIIERIKREVPQLMIGVRLSVFDMLPFEAKAGDDSDSTGAPMEFDTGVSYECGFGVDKENPLAVDLAEPIRLLNELKSLGVFAVNLSCGSPYYNPHIQRPAIFPPSDGYQPPEDPLIGVARQIHATRECREAVSNLPVVGTGYSYLQDYLPHVAQACVSEGWTDMVGLGRMVLSYPELPSDVLGLGSLQRKKVCRTFSDCTTAPRNGIVSGCFPLDSYYKSLPEYDRLKKVKRR